MRCFLLLLCTVLSLSLFAQKHSLKTSHPEKGFVITSHIAGLGGQKVYLTNKPYSWSTGFVLKYYDSTRAVDGHFVFRGVQREPGFLSVEIAGKPSGIYTMLMDNDSVTLIGDTANFSRMKPANTTEFRLFVETLRLAVPANYNRRASEDSANAAYRRGDTALTKQYIWMERWYNQERARANYRLIIANPDRYAGLTAINWIRDQLGDDTARLAFNTLSKRIRNHSEAGRIHYELFTVPQITGLQKKAPMFRQQDSLQNWVSLSSYKGKYVLIDFWASWCSPCRAENPNLLAAYKQFRTRQFDILGISLDHNRQKWLAAVRDDALPWQQVSDLKGWANEVSQQYGIRSIPMNFLIDPNGVIIAKDLRGAALQQFLEKTLP